MNSTIFFRLRFIFLQFFSILDFFFEKISGGNQRDLARAKAQKKLVEAKKGVRTDNLTVEQRKARWVQTILDRGMPFKVSFILILFYIFFRDADVMREKQKKKEEEAAAAASKKK